MRAVHLQRPQKERCFIGPRSGRRRIAAPVSPPLALPPFATKRGEDVYRFLTNHSPAAIWSSIEFCLLCFIPAKCQLSPYSPPPRIPNSEAGLAPPNPRTATYHVSPALALFSSVTLAGIQGNARLYSAGGDRSVVCLQAERAPVVHNEAPDTRPRFLLLSATLSLQSPMASWRSAG